MKDIHNHILFGIDDGSYDLEESIQIIEQAKENGYTDLILTPHYREIQNYVADNEEKVKLFEQLKEELSKRNIEISIYLGNEVALDEDLFYYLSSNQILTINNSRYILIEFPLFEEFKDVEEYLDKLQRKGYTPIIAHPERYGYYKNLELFERIVNKGVLLQGNIGSLYGKYGKEAKTRIEELLKRHMIHFIGSDVHHSKQTSYGRIHDVVRRIEELTGSSIIVEDLVDKNIEKVINDKEIETYTIREPKRRLKLFRRTVR